MTTTTIHMTEVDRCLVCGDYIGMGNDPAVCGRQYCRDVFEYECDFNRVARDPSWQDVE